MLLPNGSAKIYKINCRQNPLNKIHTNSQTK